MVGSHRRRRRRRRFVAIGNNGEIATVWTSHDGITWTRQTDVVDATEHASMEQAIAGGPSVIIVGIETDMTMPDVASQLVDTVIWIGSPG